MKKKKILSIIVAMFFMNSKAVAEKEGYHTEYSNGVIYIGDREYLENLKDVSKNDILVLDARSDVDPDMKVLASYLINDLDIQKEILEILLEYEKNNPSRWDRSLKSMQREWYAHNLMALFSYKRDRTMDVDFNNSDEEKYTKEYIKKKIWK